MVKLGFHVSIAGAFKNAVSEAVALECDTFQIFTRSPRVWKAKAVDETAATEFLDALNATNIGPVVDHMPYLPNLAAENPEVYEKSVATLVEEIKRCDTLKIPYLVTHLGHYGAEGHAKGLEKVISGISSAIDETPKSSVMILLENTSNEKNSIGGNFSEIGEIDNGVGAARRIGFCFDTCHAGAAGYDLKGRGAEEIFKEFESEAGPLSRIKVIHLNDMKGEIGSHLDRHEHLGLGTLGEKTIADVLHLDGLSECAFIMETPSDDVRSYTDDMKVARRLSSIPT